MKLPLPFLRRDPVVAVVRLTGMIASGNRGLSDAGIAQAIERAFSRGKPAAVALVINSPGGSPAQSSLIAARIRRLSESKNVSVIAFVEDVAASGGYWLACAADEIFVDPTSVVGSIGVISAGFGFPEAIEKLGVERRVHTAGRSKSFLDPFRPEQPDDVARLRALQDQLHETFIDYVKGRRGSRLAEDEEIFTGQVWIGARAVTNGLADGVGHLVAVMKARYGDKTRFNVYGGRRSLLRRVGLDAGVLGSSLAAAVEERALWARYGL